RVGTPSGSGWPPAKVSERWIGRLRRHGLILFGRPDRAESWKRPGGFYRSPKTTDSLPRGRPYRLPPRLAEEAEPVAVHDRRDVQLAVTAGAQQVRQALQVDDGIQVAGALLGAVIAVQVA